MTNEELLTSQGRARAELKRLESLVATRQAGLLEAATLFDRHASALRAIATHAHVEKQRASELCVEIADHELMFLTCQHISEISEDSRRARELAMLVEKF